jgi:hypothetical protein
VGGERDSVRDWDGDCAILGGYRDGDLVWSKFKASKIAIRHEISIEPLEDATPDRGNPNFEKVK